MRKKACTVLTVILFLFLTDLSAQSSVIDGKVLSSTGFPLSGATVRAGKANAVTGNQGEFSIKVAKGTELTISYVGYADLKVPATNGMVATLQVSSTVLEDVIVTGVASATSRKKLTVSITKIGEDRLNVVPATSAASALAGKVAGVRMSAQSGSPGGGVDLLLRGDNNIGIGSSPLILVDGVILDGALSDINVDDVESMEVVKGAAASALYGSRAANGVIAITSKRGNRLALGTSKVTVRNELGFQQISNYIDIAEHHPFALAADWQTAKGQYTKYEGVTYPAGYMGGYDYRIVGSRKIDADHYMDNEFGVTRDQQKEFFKTGQNYTNYVAISSHYAKTNIFASFENNSQSGIVQNTNGYNRQNYRLNIDHQVAPWLKISATNLFVNTHTQYPGDGGGIFFNIVLAEPDNNLYMANPVDGQPYYLRHNHWSNEKNPLYSTWKNQRNDNTRRWIGNYTANVKLTRWATFDVSHSIEISNYHYTSYDPYDTWAVGGGGGNPYGITYTKGGLYKYFDENNSQNTQATLNLFRKFNDLSVKGKLSYLYENKTYESFSVSSSQFAVRNLPTMENFTTIRDAGSEEQTIKATNYFGILSLDYKDRYLFDGMYRYDGSSLFGEDARYASYYRASGAYRISEDVKIPGIQELKIRAAHGTAGLRPGFNWQYETYNISNGITSPGQKGNKLLKPSKTSETEVGLDVEFLNRFTFQANYAMAKTTDQFLNVPLVPFVNDGYTSQYQNAGTVESKTLELTLGANWYKHKDFSWTSNIVFSSTKTTITELPIPAYQSGPDGLFYIKQGEVYGAIYGYSWVRSMDQMAAQLPAGKTVADYEMNSDGYVVPKGSQGTVNEKAIKLKDATGADAFVRIGDGLPKFNMGISNTFTYKNFSLYVLIDIKSGGDVYNRKSQWLTRDSRNGIMDMSGVDPANKKTYDYYQNFYDVNTNNSYWVEDASYVKLREVALGYTVKGTSLPYLGKIVKSMSARVIGRNLLTFSKYSGYDPEVGSIRSPYDGTGTYPNYRNIAFSLSFDF